MRLVLHLRVGDANQTLYLKSVMRKIRQNNNIMIVMSDCPFIANHIILATEKDKENVNFSRKGLCYLDKKLTVVKYTAA